MMFGMRKLGRKPEIGHTFSQDFVQFTMVFEGHFELRLH